MLTPPRVRAVGVPRSALAIGLAGALVLSACGSEDDDGAANAASSEDTEACVQAAEDFLADWQEFPTTLPESPPARYTPLEQAPPSGMSVVYLAQPFPAATSTGEAVAEAASEIGWEGSSLVYDGTLPDLIAKFEQAISQGPDFIATSGYPAAALQQQIDAAEAAGIDVILGASADEPTGTPGLAAVVNGTETARLIGELHAYQMLADSGCTGNTVIFSLDYPIIDVSDQAFQGVVEENCASCDVSIVKIQGQDIGTPDATQQMVAQLQADPSVKYAYTVIGNLADGLAPALRSAGLEDVRIFGQVPDEESIASLRNGTHAWWVNQNSTIQGYEIVDAALRIALTGETQVDAGGYPLALLTPENVPDGEGFPVIPEDILDLYVDIWTAASSG